jgi:hypothetical protein
MLVIEVRFENDSVKVRLFGSTRFHWSVVRLGEADQLTGWSFDELRRLGEGIWEFSEAACVANSAAAASA